MRKKLSTCIIVLLSVFAITNAYSQTPSCCISTTGKTTTSISIAWSPGSGANRIVTCALASNPTAGPVNGATYGASPTFGSGSNLGNGNFCVYNSNGNSCTIVGLTPNTQYRIIIFEYTYAAFIGNAYYTANAPIYYDYSLAVEPTVQASALAVSNILTTTATLNFTPGNGAYNLLALRAATAYANPPVDGTNYGGSTVYNGAGVIVGTAPYPAVLSTGTATSIATTGLAPGTTYTGGVFTYNGLNGANNYLTSSYPVKTFTTLAAEPTSSSNTIAFTNITNSSMTVSWNLPSSGGGTNRIVTCKQGTVNNDLPVDATAYVANAAYGSGSQIGGASGAYVVYNGTGNFVNVTGLSNVTNYAFSVYEYNVSTNTYNLTYNYLTSSYLTGWQQTLAVEPTVPASALTFSNITSNSVRATWANGNGANRIVGVASGRKQGALGFNGTSDFVSIPNESIFDFTTAMTVEAWVYIAPFSGYESIVTKGNDSWILQCTSAGNKVVFSVIIGGVGQSVFGNRNLGDGKWHHVAGVYNGSQLMVYVDGALDGTLAVTGTIDNGVYPVEIGSSASLTRDFTGQIDEVRVWSVANSVYTIKNNMNKTLIGNEYGLKGYWKLDDGYQTSSTAKNSSLIAGIDGTLNGLSTSAETSFTGNHGWVYSGAKVNVPLDFSTYNDNTAFMSTSNNSFYYGNLYFTVYKGPDSTSVNVTNLSPASWYAFGVFEFNGVLGNNNYLTDQYAIGDVLTLPASTPSITNFTPTSGFVGSIVTINGTGFNATAASNTVFFGATKATVLTANPGGTQLTVKVPAGATFDVISVTNNTLTGYSTKPFVITSPCGSSVFSATSLNTGISAVSYYAGDVRAADIDLDGLPDIIGVSPYGYASVTRNTSTSTTVSVASSPYYIYNASSSSADLDVADFDGDGRLDIAVTNPNTSSFIVSRNASTVSNITFGLNAEFAGTPGYTISDIVTADFDKDGKPDIMISYNNNVVSYFKNTSSIGCISFSAKTDITLGASSAITAIAAGDIDGDGKMDIAVAGGAGNQINYLRNTSTPGTISFAAFTTTTLSAAATGIVVGDVDNDNKPEIIYGSGTTNVGILKNNSTVGNINISASPTLLTALANTPSDMKLADLDGDAKADITVGYLSGSQVSIFKNNSLASVNVATKFDFTMYGTTANPTAVAICDMNADSKPDVLSTTNSNYVSYFQNNINALAAEPTVQASALTFSGVTTSQITLNFTPGNGSNKVIFVRAATSVAQSPSDGVSYVPNTVFGSGSDLGGGNYCVFDGNGNSVTVTGLQSNTAYTFSVYEYNGLLNCQYNYMPNTSTNSKTQFTNNNPPTLAAISDPASICQNSGLQTINLTGIGTGAGNEVQTLVITASSNNTGLIPNPTVNYTSPATTGTLTYTPVAGVAGTAVITVTINDGANNNNTSQRTFTVTVDNLPTVAAAGSDQQICPGVASLAGNTPVYGTGLWTIVSTTNGAITITSATNPTTTVNNFTIGDSAYFNWTISNGACPSSSDTVKVKRKNCPTTADFTVNSNSECLNGSPTFTFTDASVASGATITSWNWNFGPGAFPGTANTKGPHTVTYTTGGNKTVVLIVQDNLSVQSTETKPAFITITDVPDPAGNVSGSSTVCQGQNGVTYSVPTILGATGYTWNLPTGATLISGVNTNNITVNYGTGAISGNITVRGTNSCGNGALSANFPVTINPLPSAAGVISGSASVCEGATGITYTVPTITNGDPTGYHWTVPVGATITSSTNTNSITVSYAMGAQSGTVTVYGTNTCGNGVTSSLNVTVNPYPDAADIITGITSITTCPSTSGVTYSIALVNNATSYNWTVPSGVTITSGTGTNSIVVDYTSSAVSGNIKVIPVNSCGNGASSTLPVTVNTLPDIAGIISGQDTITLCPVSNGKIYSVSPIFNTDKYIWTLPAGATIISGDSTNTITVNYSGNAVSGNITVHGRNNCGTGVSSSLPVLVSTVPTQQICMVTVDSLSTHNIIYWEKAVTADIDSFRIYREDVTGIYTHIGSVPYDSLSEYHDYGVNPNTKTVRYKLSVIDTCGNESLKSNFHNTIYIIDVGNGQYTWNPLYTIENSPNPVSQYALMRDTASNGNWVQIATTAGTQNTLTDPSYASYPNGRWRVEALGMGCTPTRTTINTTRSNIKNAASMSGIKNNTILNQGVQVYPNPASEMITIEYPVGYKKYQLQIINALGQVVYSEALANDGAYNGIITKQLDVSVYEKGIYMMNIQTEYGSTFKRIAIQ